MKPYAKIPPTKLAAGKKIDLWKFSMPNGKTLEVDIFLHSGSGEIAFTAQCTHPAFKFLTGKQTDLQVLRDILQEDVREAIESFFGRDWGHGKLIEVEYADRRRNGSSHTSEGRQFDLSFRFSPVRYDLTTPQGNRGETNIIARETPVTVIQRSHSDEFERGDRTDLSPASMMFHSERGKTVSRVIIPETVDLDDQLSAIEDTIARFSALLAERMSPQNLAHNGPPSPADLSEMMSQAADPDHHITVVSVDGFRM